MPNKSNQQNGADESDYFARQPHYLHELPFEDEERLGKLFTKLDKDGNGKIDILDLRDALKQVGLHHQYAEKFMKSSKSSSGDLSLADFIYYVREHEKNLRLHFSHLDKNKDGKIDLDELIWAFNELGIPLDHGEGKKLLQRMDQDGSLNISYDEWRDFLLLAPSTDIHQLIGYWRHSTYLDIGEDMNVPDDFTKKEMASGAWWRYLAAGGMAGMVSRTCTAPLDRLKVFLQVGANPSPNSSFYKAGLLQVQPQKLPIKECFYNMLKEGGVIGLWRGNGINVLKIAPESAVKFATYEKIKRIFRGDTDRQLKLHERFLAGSCAGGFSQTVIYPMEVLKTRLALRKTGQYRNIADAAIKIYQTEGARSFYRGYVPNLLGILPYAGIDLAMYETMRRRWQSHHPDKEKPDWWVLLMLGATSSTLGQITSYPLALIRTRLQAQVLTPTAANRRIGMVSVFNNIIHREGFSGLYRGITPNFIKVLPAVSISYVVYESTSQLLGVKSMT